MVRISQLYTRLADDTYEQEYEAMFNPNKSRHRNREAFRTAEPVDPAYG